jgi:hypothetical protein
MLLNKIFVALLELQRMILSVLANTLNTLTVRKTVVVLDT